MRKLVYIDVETTGLTEKHGLIQLSGIIVINDEVKEEFDFKVRPFRGEYLNNQAAEVTGITREDLEKPPYEDPTIVHGKFISVLEKYVNKYDKTDKFFFIGYNSAFDMQMLRIFFEKNHDLYIGSWFFFPHIDVMTIACAALMERRPDMVNFKLSTVARELGLKVDEDKLHDAMEDIYLTREIHQLLQITVREK